MTSPRHSWSEPVRFEHKSERECRRCGLVKVSRHEADGPRDLHWIEWWRDCEKVELAATPPCDARLEVRA